MGGSVRDLKSIQFYGAQGNRTLSMYSPEHMPSPFSENKTCPVHAKEEIQLPPSSCK